MPRPSSTRPDAIGVVDVDPDSRSYGRLVGQFDMPNAGDELHPAQGGSTKLLVRAVTTYHTVDGKVRQIYWNFDLYRLLQQIGAMSRPRRLERQAASPR
jgi:hypothetical protein